MSNLFNKIKDWYFKYHEQFASWFSTDKQTKIPPERSRLELPLQLAETLQTQIQNLATPQALQTAINEEIATIQQWQEQPTLTTNSLIIIGTPVEPLDRIISESLTGLEQKTQLSVRLLEWIGRPSEPGTIADKLIRQLGIGTSVINHKPREIVVIPNLGWCFLRSVEGLESIDYLKETIFSDRSRFWLIGCNRVAWDYFNYVSQFQAYCGKVFYIPSLEREQLQAWFEPVTEKMTIDFTLDREPNEVKKATAIYFEQLKVLSEGISTIAAQLLMRSLYVPSAEQDDCKSNPTIQAKNPTLPELPELSPEEQYLLYSLLLHHEINLADLSISLGEDTAITQNLVQNLRRQGVIEQRNQLLRVNPLHYPNLIEELDGNNFPITK